MALPLTGRLLAVLFSAGEPLERKRLVTLLGTNATDLGDALDAVRAHLAESGLTLIETDQEVELRTAPEAAEVVQKLRESELSRDLGKAGLETMAMILYRNGATRSEIDWVRGVNSGAALRSLLLRGLIERTEDPNDKRRAFYLPTVDALAHLGVGKREDLPRYSEFSAALRDEEVKMAAATE